ncbi:uncharacterized protein LOC120489360 isoform X3 [Tachysurus ichikawai]
MRAHITDSVKEAIKRTNSISAVIPGGTTKYLQPLDISVNRAFEVALRVQWEAWMTSGEKTGRMRKSNLWSNLPVGRDSVEHCQKIHYHQWVSKGWTAAC